MMVVMSLDRNAGNLSISIFSYIFFSLGFSPYTLYVAFMLFSLMMLFNVLYFAKINCDLQVGKFFKNILFKCFLAFLLAMLVSSIPVFVIPNEFIQFMGVCVLGVLSYVAFIWLFALSRGEKMLILNLKGQIVAIVNNLFKRNNKLSKS